MNILLILGILVLILGVIYGPLMLLKGMGYLVQKFKFGVSFRELHEYHKKQDKLERERR